MSKRSIILVLVIILASVAIGLVPSVLQLVAERGLIKIRERGVRVQVHGIAGFLIGVSADSAEGWAEVPLKNGAIRSFPVQITVENAAISLRPRLNPFHSSVELSAAAYGGKLGATLTELFATPHISAQIDGLDIGLHPQLRALGMEQGSIRLSLTDHPLRPVWERDATYALDLKNVDLLPPSSIQQISGVSRLENGQASLRATIRRGGGLTIDSGTFDSSLASGTLLGSAGITTGGELTSVNATVRVNLDRDGSPKLAAWLPIITNQAVSSDAKSFVCNFRSANCGSSGSIRVGAGCLRATCAG
jgi:hypothetical protein